jgi:alanine-glyoxylate transaminase/serine-glyoxylate transaminase/serine-pyruvate transaminase
MQRIFGTGGMVVLLPGAGTAATEMCLCGFGGTKCLVVRAGTFGDRLAEILAVHRAEVVDIEVPERECVTPEMVATLLDHHPDAAAVCMVHSETSTGVLHPVPEIARVVRNSSALLVVDAVSSAGGIPFEMDLWGVDVCWCASQKALGCPPGLAMAAFSPAAFDFFSSRAGEIRSWYLNPLVWKRHADEWEWHPYPTSLPTPVFAAMDEIFRRFEGEGLEAHFRRQAEVARRIRDGVCALGFELFAADEAYASPTISAFIPPEGLDEAAFREAVLRDHGFMIAGGFGKLRGRIIRVGHMGPGLENEYVEGVLEAMRDAIETMEVE